MKKSKTTRSTGTAVNVQHDATHLAVILVIGIFFGFLGFQLGKTATSPALTMSTTESAAALRDSGSLMKQTGALMITKGQVYRDQELTQNGETMEMRGDLLITQGTELLGNLGK